VQHFKGAVEVNVMGNPTIMYWCKETCRLAGNPRMRYHSAADTVVRAMNDRIITAKTRLRLLG